MVSVPAPQAKPEWGKAEEGPTGFCMPTQHGSTAPRMSETSRSCQVPSGRPHGRANESAVSAPRGYRRPGMGAGPGRPAAGIGTQKTASWSAITVSVVEARCFDERISNCVRRFMCQTLWFAGQRHCFLSGGVWVPHLSSFVKMRSRSRWQLKATGAVGASSAWRSVPLKHSISDCGRRRLSAGCGKHRWSKLSGTEGGRAGGGGGAAR
jgi:hypothetical protein